MFADAVPLEHERSASAARRATLGTVLVAGGAACFTFSVLLVFLAVGPGAAFIGPRIVVGELPDLHLRPSEQRIVNVPVANTGWRPLRVDSLATSCGCAQIGGAPPVIMAGERAEITLSLTAPASPGAFVQRVQIVSNDPAQKLLDIELRGHVVNR